MGTGLFNLEYKKQKTHPQKWDGSSLVAGTGLEPVTFGL